MDTHVEKTSAKQRYLEFDVARVLALLLMPFTHITESLYISGVISDDILTRNAFVLKIASLGAFVFMCLLGVNLLLTSRATASDYAKRGIRLLLLGAELNVVRYVIPGAIAAAANRNIEYLRGTLYYSAASDILYFSGLCFLFFAAAKRFNFKWYAILLIGCALNIMDSVLPVPDIKNDTLDAIAGNFIYVNEASAFSFSQWFAVVCLGYAFGKFFLKQDNKTRFYKQAAAAAVVLSGVVLAACKLFGIDIMSQTGCQYDSYNLSLLGIFVLFMVYLFLQSIVYFISAGIKNVRVIDFSICFSKGITAYYCLQWVLVCWGNLALVIAGFGSDRQLSLSGLLVYGLLITAASTALTFCFQRNRAKKAKKANTKAARMAEG